MFLIRLAFWLGLVVLLLPTDERQQAKLYGTAVSTVERVTTFCDRNAQLCSASVDFWGTFLRKADWRPRYRRPYRQQAQGRGDAGRGCRSGSCSAPAPADFRRPRAQAYPSAQAR
jgi:hypothetical protein